MSRPLPSLAAVPALLLSSLLHAGMPIERVDIVHPFHVGSAADRDVTVSRQALSADGQRLVLLSEAGNLVAGASAGSPHAYLIDRVDGRIERLSVLADGSPLPGFGGVREPPLISGDGLRVVFTSTAFIDGQWWDGALLLDLRTRSLQPLAWNGRPLDSVSGISHTGDALLFLAEGTAGPEAGRRLAYRIDLASGEAVNVSRLPDGRSVEMLYFAALSPNGRFACHASEQGVYVVSSSGDAVERVDVADGATPSESFATWCAVSDDGLTVSFVSDAPWLRPAGSARSHQLFKRDRARRRTLLLGANAAGAIADQGVHDMVMSADGRSIVFQTLSRNLQPPHPRNGMVAVFVQRDDAPARALDAGGHGFHPLSLSADGRFVALTSLLDPTDPARPRRDGIRQLHLFDAHSATHIAQLSLPRSGGDTLHSPGCPGGLQCMPALRVSADGRHVAYPARDPRAYAEPAADFEQVLLRQMPDGAPELVSIDSAGRAAQGHSQVLALSADARFVVFASRAPGLVAGITSSFEQIYLRDRQQRTTRLISRRADGRPGNRPSTAAAVSADGRRIVFVSEANDLVAGDGNGEVDVFLWRDQTDRVELISRTRAGTSASGASFAADISADGRRIAFVSLANDLDTVDPDPGSDVFVHEVDDNRLWRVPGLDADDRFDVPSGVRLSADGSTVLFQRDSIVPWSGPFAPSRLSLVAVELDRGVTDWINRYDFDPQGGEFRRQMPVIGLSLSADGQVLVFEVLRGEFAGAGTVGSEPALVRFDRRRREARIIGAEEARRSSDFGLSAAVLSADGEYVVFAGSDAARMPRFLRAGPAPRRSTVWWNPEESGWGLVTIDHGDAIGGIWYTNDASGRPTWYLLPGLTASPSGRLSGDALRFSGVAFDREDGGRARSAEVAGQVALSFVGDESLLFEYAVDGVTRAVELGEFAFGTRVGCTRSPDPSRRNAGNYTDIWYGGEAESGWGLQIVDTGPQLFAFWYGYDTDGRALYLIATTQRRADGSFHGPLFRSRDGAPLAAVGAQPVSSGADEVGAASFRFSDGAGGVFEYTIGGVKRSRPIERLRIGNVPIQCGAR